MQKYEILEHPADLKIKASGQDLSEVFVNLALGVASQQLGVDDLGGATANESEWEELVLESESLESLLIDWLNEILYRSDVNQKVYLDFKILQFSESPAKIKTKIRGQKVAQKKSEIKAATYHELEIQKTEGTREATVIFDI